MARERSLRGHETPLGCPVRDLSTFALVKVVPFLVPLMKGLAMAVTASEARKNLFPLIEQVNNDRTPIEITSRRGDAVLMSRADFDALQETAHLLRVPANAKRLLESLMQARSGMRAEHRLAE